MGVKIPKYCTCGKYQPRSTKGVIDLSCRNCGGEYREPHIGGRKLSR